MSFTNYQLYRTTPKLSGNVKLDLVVDSIGSNLYIRNFHLRPLSKYIAYNDVDQDVTVRPHQLNLARFYDKTKTGFFNAKIDPKLSSDWPIVLTKNENKDKIKNWDDTYWAGTQRMSHELYNTTHEVLVPLWLEQVDDIQCLEFVVGLSQDINSQPFIKKTLKFDNRTTFHNKVSKYLNNYFEYIGLKEGNNKCLNIDLKGNKTYIYGLNVEDGNLQTRTDFNLTRNLLYRERPLLEANSLLTNMFNDVHLILPQLINFNICFDPTNWLPKSAQFLTNQHYYVSVDVKVNGKLLEKRDIYTNHQFVPRPFNEDIYTAEDKYTKLPYNALDYKHDYLCSDLIHKNKMTQPICHWRLSESEEQLFNLYDGFGAAYNGSVINHFFGTVNDLTNTKTDPIIPNTSPFGPKRLGDGDEVSYYIENAEHYTFDDPYFVQLSNGWVNGFRMKYNPSETDEIQEILIAGMTTANDYTQTLFKTADTQTITDKDVIAIWEAKYDKDGNDIIGDRLFTDMDDRFSDNPNFSHRLEINSYGLYLCVKKIDWPKKVYIKNGQETPAKALAVLIWDQRVEKNDYNKNLIYKTKLSYQNIGFIKKAIHEYVKKYNGEQNIPESLKYLELLDNHISSSEPPSVWYFNQTILQKQDNRVSNAAQEIIYKKAPANDAYVYRFDGPIKPCIYKPVASRDGKGGYLYEKHFGLNYLWEKQIYSDNPQYNTYANTGVPPKYPSLSYDSMINDPEYGECLLYDEPSDRAKTVSKEYKWFDKSYIMQYPVQIQTETDLQSASNKQDEEAAVKSVIYKVLKQEIADEMYDEDYINKIYDIKYELLRVKQSQDPAKKLLYTYKITMKLK